MSAINPDRATDWIAIALSTVVCGSLWGLFLWEYLYLDPAGEVSPWLMYAAVGMTAVASITLFGYEKVRKAIELRD